MSYTPASISPTLVTAKGDIIAATADDVVTYVNVGGNGAVLTADSSATAGVAWHSPITTLVKWGG